MRIIAKVLREVTVQVAHESLEHALDARPSLGDRRVGLLLLGNLGRSGRVGGVVAIASRDLGGDDDGSFGGRRTTLRLETLLHLPPQLDALLHDGEPRGGEAVVALVRLVLVSVGRSRVRVRVRVSVGVSVRREVVMMEGTSEGGGSRCTLLLLLMAVVMRVRVVRVERAEGREGNGGRSGRCSEGSGLMRNDLDGSGDVDEGGRVEGGGSSETTSLLGGLNLLIRLATLLASLLLGVESLLAPSESFGRILIPVGRLEILLHSGLVVAERRVGRRKDHALVVLLGLGKGLLDDVEDQDDALLIVELERALVLGREGGLADMLDERVIALQANLTAEVVDSSELELGSRDVEDLRRAVVEAL
jgi:hypothetical protein